MAAKLNHSGLIKVINSHQTEVSYCKKVFKLFWF